MRGRRLALVLLLALLVQEALLVQHALDTSAAPWRQFGPVEALGGGWIRGWTGDSAPASAAAARLAPASERGRALHRAGGVLQEEYARLWASLAPEQRAQVEVWQAGLSDARYPGLNTGERDVLLLCAAALEARAGRAAAPAVPSGGFRGEVPHPVTILWGLYRLAPDMPPEQAAGIREALGRTLAALKTWHDLRVSLVRATGAEGGGAALLPGPSELDRVRALLEAAPGRVPSAPEGLVPTDPN